MSADYQIISEPTEKWIMIDIYIVAPIGMALSTMILYSLINLSSKLVKQNSDDRFLKYALRSGYTLNIFALIFYFFKIASTDLIFPTDQLILNAPSFATLFDSFYIIAWSIAQTAFYFAFAFMYLSVFRKNEEIDLCLKILMVFAATGVISYITFYLVADVSVVSDQEIGVSEKHNIYVITEGDTSNHFSVGVASIAIIITDLIFVCVLFYRFVSSSKKQRNDKYYIGIRGAVLLFVASTVLLVMAILFFFSVIFDSIQCLINSICLFLMFESNKEIYDNLCGKCCDKCCAALCFGSQYKPIRPNDDEEDNL